MAYSLKYARIERERRFLLAERPPGLGQSDHRTVEDLYITSSRLRLRKVCAPDGSVLEYKLNQKIDDDAAHRIVTSVYLTPQEYLHLSRLPGKRLVKHRHRHVWGATEFGVDVFAGALEGLVLAEVEAESDATLISIEAPRVAHIEVTDRVEFTGGYLAWTAAHTSRELARSLLGDVADTPTNADVMTIRALLESDPPIIAGAFTNKPESQYRGYLVEQESGVREVLVAWSGHTFAGYVTIVWTPTYTPFRAEGIPEIQDLNVVVALRRRGFATALLDEAEARIAQRCRNAGIGVGLHSGYNAAQRLYGLRGYVPDGHGVVHGTHFVLDREHMPFDDDLVLHLTKAV